MNLTPTDIKKFRQLYIKHFDIKLNDDDAQEKLSALVRQMEITYRPISINQLSKLRDLNGNEHNEKLVSRN
jgi:hypothetical protein